MNTQKTPIGRNLASVCGLLSMCTFAYAADPVIHVSWDENPPPILNFHYTVSTSSPASVEFPNVELRSGSLTWRVWSTDTDNPNDVGDIGVISCPVAANFGVRVQDTLGGAGAREVKRIELQPTSGSNYSNLVDVSVTGNITENLIVQESSGGIGGEVNMRLAMDAASEVDVDGDMTIPKVGTIQINGNILGDVDILSDIENGKIFEILGQLTGDIDLNDSNVDGILEIKGGGGDILNGGDITTCGQVFLQTGGDPPAYSGTVTFDNVYGWLRTEAGNLSGTMHVTGDVKSTGQVGMAPGELLSGGKVQIDGNVDAGGVLFLAGDTAGDIAVGGVLDGRVNLGNPSFNDIEFSGSLLVDELGTAISASDGDVIVEGTVTSTGIIEIGHEMTGNITVSKEFHGDIDIDGHMSGVIVMDLLGNPFQPGALIYISQDFKSDGKISIKGDAKGTVDIDGDVDGVIDLEEMPGVLTIGGDLHGDIEVDGNCTGSITVDGKLDSLGRVLVVGELDGPISIGEGTHGTSLIHVAEGIDSSGSITITVPSLESSDGDVSIGPLDSSVPDILFDGPIKITGDNSGTISARGCHATTADLDICICGTNTGKIDLTQTGCNIRVSHSCVSGCP